MCVWSQELGSDVGEWQKTRHSLILEGGEIRYLIILPLEHIFSDAHDMGTDWDDLQAFVVLVFILMEILLWNHISLIDKSLLKSVVGSILNLIILNLKKYKIKIKYKLPCRKLRKILNFYLWIVLHGSKIAFAVCSDRAAQGEYQSHPSCCLGLLNKIFRRKIFFQYMSSRHWGVTW